MKNLPKILLVDDKIENLIALERLLVGFQVETIRALSGNEALQQTLHHEFALALVDVQMPEMDGYETVSLMRSSKETRFLPVIFVSAIHRDDFHVVKGIESGAVDFITKPINPPILKGKIKVFLELYEQQKNLESEIDRRRQVELEVSKKNALLNAFLHSIPDIVFQKNINGKYINCNKAFLEFTGKKRDEIVGKTDQDIYPVKLAKIHSDSDKEVLSSGAKKVIELWAKDDSGNLRLLETHKSLVSDENENAIGIIGISRDVTERHNDREELHRAKEEAEAANIAKSMFLANMSHEIRTPMNGIIGMTDILQQSQLTEEQQEFVRIISLSGNNLLTIINDILDFSKIEAGRIVMEKIDFKISEPIEETTKLLQFKAQQKGLKLEAEISSKIPELVNGDPLRTKQILINLVNNAIKFTEKGSVKIKIEVIELKKTAIKVLFKVIDSGIGISEEGKQKLFKAFSQTDASTSRKFGGTGLGLTISKRLVELMNGEIGVESENGQGSTFWYTLNYSLPAASDMHQENATSSSVEHSVLNILLAEDNPINQRVALFNLKKMGHNVEIAGNGSEALEMFKTNSYDLVLMDIQMPVMDGLESTELIRRFEIEQKAKNPIPIIAMTANAMKGDREKFISKGMSGYISKPFKVIELEKVLKIAKR